MPAHEMTRAEERKWIDAICARPKGYLACGGPSSYGRASRKTPRALWVRRVTRDEPGVCVGGGGTSGRPRRPRALCRAGAVARDQRTRMLAACGPLGPAVMSNSIFWFSSSVRKPPDEMAE